MEPDDELCLCFHVTQRKVEAFIRHERPRVPSQLSACGGAGTGCGWCRPFLSRLLERSLGASGTRDGLEKEPDAEQYRRERAHYVRDGKGIPPPGAEPDLGSPG
jgi:bacterioferritin-associated ferredoxin